MCNIEFKGKIRQFERNLEYWDGLPVDHDVSHGGGQQGVEDAEVKV